MLVKIDCIILENPHRSLELYPYYQLRLFFKFKTAVCRGIKSAAQQLGKAHSGNPRLKTICNTLIGADKQQRTRLETVQGMRQIQLL
jgi:hypothetical protein